MPARNSSRCSLAIAAVCGLALSTSAFAQLDRPGTDSVIQPKPTPAVQPPAAPAGQPGGQTPATPVSGDVPEVTIEKDTHDWGSVLQSDRPETDFVFTNKGKGKLIVTKVQSTCGCTVPELTKLEYLPGESGTIHVRYDPSGKNGPQSKVIRLLSNDPRRPEIPLTIKADVAPVVIIEPKAASIGTVAKKQGGTTTVKVIGRTPDFEANFVSLTRGLAYSAKILGTEPIDYQGKKLRATTIEITMKTDAPVGRQADTISIRTNDPGSPMVYVPVSGEVQGEIAVTPGVFSAGVVKPAEQFTTQVKMVNRQGKPFKIVKIEPRQPALQQVLKCEATPEDEKNPTTWILKLTGTVAPPADSTARIPPLQGQIVVTTDVDGEKNLELPFYAQVRVNPAGPTPTPTAQQPAAPAAATPGGAKPASGGR